MLNKRLSVSEYEYEFEFLVNSYNDYAFVDARPLP